MKSDTNKKQARLSPVASKKRVRLDPKVRKQQILSAAINLANTIGYHNITRDNLAGKIKVSAAVISYYFNPVSKLKRIIVKNAILDENLLIIAEAIMRRDPQVNALPEKLKEKALRNLIAK